MARLMTTLRIHQVGMALAMLFPTGVAAQLPELAMPSAISGGGTSARFFAGASADNGLSFGNTFGFYQPVDITAEIHVEQRHIGTVGNLYLVIQLGEEMLIRDAAGDYIPWDLDPATLQATAAGKTLSAVETLTIVDDVVMGPAGFSGVTLSVFFAYDSAAVPGELYYSGSPLNVTIDLQQDSPSLSLTLYTQNISQQIIQARCIICHVAGGSASATRLIYERSTTPNFQMLNYETLRDFMQTASGAANLLSQFGSFVLGAGGTDRSNWIEFVNALAGDG